MECPRRAFLYLAGAAALPGFLRAAAAQPIVLLRTRMLVPLAPGGAVDVYAKVVGDDMNSHIRCARVPDGGHAHLIHWCVRCG
jgi:tripartite-type tricarboxylate transporter receptor subunit TctC